MRKQPIKIRRSHDFPGVGAVFAHPGIAGVIFSGFYPGFQHCHIVLPLLFHLFNPITYVIFPVQVNQATESVGPAAGDGVTRLNQLRL